ncbi:hypothetical protein LINGRAPRIM_LOCUS2628 [Linum grandiflorum]
MVIICLNRLASMCSLGVFSAAESQFSTGVRCVLNSSLYKGLRGKSVKSNYRHEQINTTNMDLHTRKIREVQTT